jgi:hypothetical protein
MEYLSVKSTGNFEDVKESEVKCGRVIKRLSKTHEQVPEVLINTK